MYYIYIYTYTYIHTHIYIYICHQAKRIISSIIMQHIIISKLIRLPGYSYIYIYMCIEIIYNANGLHLTDHLSICRLRVTLFPIKGSGDSIFRPFFSTKEDWNCCDELCSKKLLKRILFCTHGIKTVLHGMKWRKAADTWSWSDSIS